MPNDPHADLEDLESELTGADDEADGSDLIASKRMTEAEFEDASVMWESGRYGIAEISSEFGVRKDALRRRFERAGSVKGSRAAVVREAAEAKMMEKALIIADRIDRTKEDHYGWAEAIGKLSMKLIIDQVRGSAPIASVELDIRTLERTMRILQGARSERYIALGINKDVPETDKVPTLEISVLSQDQIEDIQSASMPIQVIVPKLDLNDL